MTARMTEQLTELSLRQPPRAGVLPGSLSSGRPREALNPKERERDQQEQASRLQQELAWVEQLIEQRKRQALEDISLP